MGAGSAANSEYPETAKANAELASRLGAEAGGVGSNQPNTANVSGLPLQLASTSAMCQHLSACMHLCHGKQLYRCKHMRALLQQEYQANTHGQQGSNRSNKEAPTKPGAQLPQPVCFSSLLPLPACCCRLT